MIETEGLEQSAIHKILRGLITRDQALQKKTVVMSNIKSKRLEDQKNIKHESQRIKVINATMKNIKSEDKQMSVNKNEKIIKNNFTVMCIDLEKEKGNAGLSSERKSIFAM